MPRVPQVTGQTVMPQAAPSGYIRAQATPQDFGASIGQALEQGGGRIASMGDRLAERANVIRKEDNALKVEETHAKFSDEERKYMFDPEKGVYARKGGNALTAYDDASKWYDETQQRYIEGLDDPDQRRLLQQTLTRRRDAALDGVARHVARERQTYMGEATEARVKSLTADAATVYNDPAKVDQLVQEADGVITFWGQRQGQAPEVLDAGRKAARSAIRAGVVERLAIDSPVAAKKYLDEHKGDIDGLTAAKLEKQLHSGITQDKAKGYAAKVLPRPGQSVADGDTFNTLAAAVEMKESGGQSGVVSPKGAQGVMQLMPGTAREQHELMFPGQPFDPERVRTDDAYNRQLGRGYLQRMLTKYGGNQTLALAAYNAGPGAVDSWIEKYGDPRAGAVSDAQWAAQIPYEETRNYVQGTGGRAGTRDAKVKGSLGQRVAALEEAIKNEPPEVQDRARTEFDHQWSKLVAIENDTTRKQIEDLTQTVYRTKSFDGLTPQQLSVLDEDPITRDRLEQFVRRRGEVETNLDVYNALNNMRGTDEFETINLTDPQYKTTLSPTDWKRFSDMQVAQRKSENSVEARAAKAGEQSRGTIVTQRLRDAGIDPTPKDTDQKGAAKVREFNDALDGKIAEWKANNPKKYISADDITKLADQLLIRGEIMSGAWYKPDPNKFAFELGGLTTDERSRFGIGGFMSDPKDKARVARVTGVPVESIDPIVKALKEAGLPVTTDNIATLHKRTSAR